MMKYMLLLMIAGFISCAGLKEQKQFNASIEAYQKSYMEGFLTNPRSPLGESDLDSLDFYPPDVTWKVSCTCIEEKGAQPFDMPTYSGVTRRYILYAVANCRRGRQTFSVSLYQNIHPPVNPIYKNQLFLPFKDETNGENTYGGGRYINLQVTDTKNGSLMIDFNRSYNPWCAYSDGFNCPIPPKENHLKFEVAAGEKLFRGAYKQAKAH
jgi:uncharacterized protein (DUF1684 family)